MSLVTIICVLLIVGVVLWGINALPMIDPTIKRIIYVIIVVLVAVWLIQGIFGGGMGSLGNVRIGR